MPIRKDDGGKRWVEMELTVPGTPDEVWHAMATGPGNTAWFTRATIEERVGGKLRFDFGPNGSSAGEVTVWEPPLRFGYVERDWAEGAPPVATEIAVAARSGGRCVVRMVHSLFSSTDDWDDQMEGFEKGWPGFFEVLRLYLAHFAGRPAASLFVMERVDAPQVEVWKRLTAALDLTAADAGEERTAEQAPEPFSGIVERVEQGESQRYVLMRLSAPAPAIALIGTHAAGGLTSASMALYLYGADAEPHAGRSEALWRDWLAAAVRA